MNIEYYELNEILKCFINNEMFRGEINEKETLIQLAQKHQVLPIVHYVLKKANIPIPESLPSYASQISSYVFRNRAEEVFSKVLDNIEHVYYKGSIVAGLYPVPQLRTMGDVDVLIRKEDRKRVHERLSNNGFDFTYKDDVADGVWHYKKEIIEFEVHTFVLQPDEINNKYKKFFDDAWNHVTNNGEFDWNFHFLILIAHIREHLIKSGIGIRPFLDVAVVSKNANLNWQWIESKADEIGLRRFLETVVSLIERWFGIKLPMTVDLDENFDENSLDFIMRNGVFGFDNPDNDNIELSRSIVVRGKRTRISNLCRQVFPSYKTMARIPSYSYLNKCKWLLLVAWAHRFFRGVFDENYRKKFVSRALVIDQGTKKKIELMQQWGV